MKKHIYIRSFGCQMNVRDSEEVSGLLLEKGYALTDLEEEAEVILLNIFLRTTALNGADCAG